jgi:RHS repeat-associated protein
VGLEPVPAQGPEEQVAAYQYDANGLRVRKVDSGGDRSFLLDGLSIAAEYSAPGLREAWYTQSLARIDEVLSVVNGQGKYWYQADALGSVYALTTASGGIQARGGYDVFGEPVAMGGTAVGQPFGFTGREHDADSGLVYARARYLSTGTGTWLKEDPWNFREALLSPEAAALGGVGGSLGIHPLAQNRYLYALGNAPRYADPLGRFAVDFSGALVGAGIGAVLGAYVGHVGFCRAGEGALIGAVMGGLVGAGLGELLSLRLIVKILPTILGANKFEMNLVTSLGRILGIGKIWGKQPFHFNFPGGAHLFGWAAYVLTLVAVGVIIGAVYLIILDTHLDGIDKATEP